MILCDKKLDMPVLLKGYDNILSIYVLSVEKIYLRQFTDEKMLKAGVYKGEEKIVLIILIHFYKSKNENDLIIKQRIYPTSEHCMPSMLSKVLF